MTRWYSRLTCDHVEAKFSDVQMWFNDYDAEQAESKSKRFKHDSTLSNLYPRSDYWIYADYKYMSQICTKQQAMIESVDWGVFGFEGRNGNQSTLWVGSEGASTPCHYDTYGCNLVAQLSGKKKWTLFAPSDVERLYPTRVPYEGVQCIFPGEHTGPSAARTSFVQRCSSSSGITI